MDEKKAVTMEQLLESARQGEALTMQVAQAAQEELNKAVGKSMAGQSVQLTSTVTVTAGEGAEIFNNYSARTFSESFVETGNVASGNYSHAEGYCTTADGDDFHAEGFCTRAGGGYSHAEGFDTSAIGATSHAEGYKTRASGANSHTEGNLTTAIGDYSHAEGFNTTASGNYSHAGGAKTVAEYYAETAIGRYNVKKSPSNNNQLGDYFVVGKGTSENARANIFRISDSAIYGTGSYNSSGADYAELFEWADGNPDSEDRVGRFVTLIGDKLRLATRSDDYILGIVSGNPSIVGDVHDDQWEGMYLCDVFGRPLWEDVEVPDETVEEPDPEYPGQTVTRVVIPAHTEHRQKLNPAYDGTRKYQARTERPEWDAVGLIGKLVAVDDGTCQVDGYCTVGAGGGATASESRTRFRVMKRLDGNHVQVMVLPR